MIKIRYKPKKRSWALLCLSGIKKKEEEEGKKKSLGTIVRGLGVCPSQVTSSTRPERRQRRVGHLHLQQSWWQRQ